MDNANGKTAMSRSFRLITLILSEQQCNRFSAFSKRNPFCHGIILIGKGTVSSHTLSILGITGQKRLMIKLLIPQDKVKDLLNQIVEKLKLDQPGHGVAYVTSASAIGTFDRIEKETPAEEEKTEGSAMYKKISVIVNRGNADDVMEIARRAGAQGGTILHGRGTGAACAAKLFGMEIEPEKELVMILLPSAKADQVIAQLCAEIDFEDPGNGILFVEPVLNVKGLFEAAE